MSIPKFHLVTEWDLDMYVQYFHSFRYSCGEIILISENQSLPNVIKLLMIHETTKNCIVNIMLWPVLQPVFLQITYSHHTAVGVLSYSQQLSIYIPSIETIQIT